MKLDLDSLANASADEQYLAFAKAAREDLLFYAQVCNPKYTPSSTGFHEFLAGKLQAVADGRIKRLVVSVAPRHGKSQLCSIEFPTWLLGRYPDKKIVVASYAQSLSLEMSKQARSRMESPEYRSVFQTGIAEGDAAAHEWKSSGGGMYKAVGVGGGLTGRGADVLIVDDAHKDFQDAHSATVRENVWNWFWSTAYTRLHPGGVVIIIMTRWHRDDLVGRLLDPERQKNLAADDPDSRWEYVNLPALAGDRDPLGRKAGEALFPERYPKQVLESIKSNTASYIWSAMYGGEPVVKGGNYIPVGKLNIVDAAPDGLRWVRYWDLATSDKASSDHTASIAGAYGPDGTLYLRDAVDGQWVWPDARGRIRMMAEIERIPIGVEAVGGFKTAFANLLEVMPSNILCREYGADRDKLTRALPWIALADRGKVALVRGEWNMDFIMQAESFPSGANDDLVDAVSGVVIMLGNAFSAPSPVNIHDRFTRALARRRERSLVG